VWDRIGDGSPTWEGRELGLVPSAAKNVTVAAREEPGAADAGMARPGWHGQGLAAHPSGALGGSGQDGNTAHGVSLTGDAARSCRATGDDPGRGPRAPASPRPRSALLLSASPPSAPVFAQRPTRRTRAASSARPGSQPSRPNWARCLVRFSAVGLFPEFYYVLKLISLDLGVSALLFHKQIHFD